MRLQEYANPIDDIDDPELIAWQIANAPTLPEYEENDEEAIARCQEIEAANQPVLTSEQEYEAMQAADDYVEVVEYESVSGHHDRVQEVITRMEMSGADPMQYRHIPRRDKGRLFKFEEVQPGVRKDYEYLIDGLLRYGPNAFSGPRGGGKSSTLAPMLCAIGGLIPHYPLEIKLRREVIIYTEDREQMSRIFDSMIEDGYMDVTLAELNRWVHLVDSERILPSVVARHADELSKMWTPNKKADGGIYPAGPLVVFDTISSGLEIENSNDNDDVSREIATMRQALDGKAGLLLVGHTAKDAANRAGQTMLGAQAWEANTIGSITLKTNNGERQVHITKDRFSAPVTMFNVDPRRTQYAGLDVLGSPTTIHGLYNVISPMSDEQLSDANKSNEERAADSEQEKEDKLMTALAEMLAEVDEHGAPKYPQGVPVTDLHGKLKGHADQWRKARERLVAKEKVVDPKDGQTRYVQFAAKAAPNF